MIREFEIRHLDDLIPGTSNVKYPTSGVLASKRTEEGELYFGIFEPLPFDPRVIQYWSFSETKQKRMPAWVIDLANQTPASHSLFVTQVKRIDIYLITSSSQ